LAVVGVALGVGLGVGLAVLLDAAADTEADVDVVLDGADLLWDVATWVATGASVLSPRAIQRAVSHAPPSTAITKAAITASRVEVPMDARPVDTSHPS
jgi:hypothetical protein